MIKDNYEDLNFILRFFAYRFVRSGVPGMSLDDLVQECFVSLVKAEVTYDPEKGKLSTWACHLARNRLSNIAQKLCRNKPGISLEDFIEDKKVTSPESYAIDEERITRLTEMLSPMAKELLNLRMSGYSYSDAKEKLGWLGRDLVVAKGELRNVLKIDDYFQK